MKALPVSVPASERPPKPKPINPSEIQAVDFRQVHNLFSGRVGYDEDEVDIVLDRCAETIADLTRELQAARAIIERLRAQVSDVAQPSGSGWGRCL